MNGNGTYKKIASLAILIIFLGLAETYRGTASFTLAFPFAMVSVCAFVGGLWISIISALVVSIYAIYSNLDILRAVQIVGALSANIAIVEYLRVKARQVDTADRALNEMWGLHALVTGAIADSPDISRRPAQMFDLLIQIRHKLANILTYTQGWRDLAEDKRKVIDEALEEEKRSQNDL